MVLAARISLLDHINNEERTIDKQIPWEMAVK